MTKSTYHALLIAVQEYDDLAVNDLVHPIEDARRLREVLAEEYVFDAARIQLLENPDRDELIASLEKLAKDIKPEDHLLIFFAGHGYWDPSRKQGYWLPSNARQSSRSNWISNADIRDLIVGIPCRHTLLISDACFSGGLFRTRKAFADPDRSVDMLYQLPSRKAMTSGALKEVPDESVFLHYFTDRLKKNKNAWLSSERLFVDLKEPVLNNSSNIPQYGTIQGTGDEGGDFVFLRRDGVVEKPEASHLYEKEPEMPEEAISNPTRATPMLETPASVEKKVKAGDREAKPATLTGNKASSKQLEKRPGSQIPLFAGGILGVIAIIALIMWAMGGDKEVVLPPPGLPTASLEVDKTTVVRGESIMLSWLVSNATEVRITPDVGSVDSTGSRSLEPEQDVTYTLTALGEGGEVTNTLFIQVADPAVQPTTTPPPASSERNAFAERYPEALIKDFVLIEAGTFMMGSENEENESPVHNVTISQPFYMGKYEVTQSQWEAVMGNNPSRHKGSNNPVDGVSWHDVMAFVETINALEKCNGCYRLPTEAEWEYAARAGTTTAYSFGDDETRLGSYAWYSGNARDKTHPVGEKNANPWGLYDMQGNVWEWVNDGYRDYSADSVTDPTGSPEPGAARILRGGSKGLNAGVMRSSFRSEIGAGHRNDDAGFRLVRTYP